MKYKVNEKVKFQIDHRKLSGTIKSRNKIGTGVFYDIQLKTGERMMFINELMITGRSK